MGTFAKAMLGVFFLVLVTLSGIGTVMAGADTTKAQNYHADVIEEIECSNYNDAVIASCITQAEREGYELAITPVARDAAGNVQTAEVILKYDYGIELFQLSQKKSIRGFTR